jgi:hypothetical protein
MLTTDGDTDSATDVSAVSNATARDSASSSTAVFLGEAAAVPSVATVSTAPSTKAQGCRSMVRIINVTSLLRQ